MDEVRAPWKIYTPILGAGLLEKEWEAFTPTVNDLIKVFKETIQIILMLLETYLHLVISSY